MQPIFSLEKNALFLIVKMILAADHWSIAYLLQSKIATLIHTILPNFAFML